MIKSRKNGVATKMRKREVRAANRTTKWCPKSPTAGLWHPKWRPKSPLEPLGLAPGHPKMALLTHFGHHFWIFFHFGIPWPRFWEPRGIPWAMLAPQIGSSSDHSLLRSNIILLCTCWSIWRTIGSWLDHTFNNLFICKSGHLVCCPSQRTHCCISKISKYTSLETRVSRTRKKVVD